MTEVHLRALEAQIRLKMTEIVRIDLHNNQASNTSKENSFTPSVYIDFGAIKWRAIGMGSGDKEGATTLVFHLNIKQTAPTHDKANDTDGKRLNRLALNERLLQALDGFSLTNAAGEKIMSQLLLSGSKLDTMHDGLADDILAFDCLLFYKKKWQALGWQKVLITGYNTEYDKQLSML